MGISTGDVSINTDAPLRVMTTEILRNSIFQDPASLSGVKYVILDEIHYLDNVERGTVWEESLIFAPREIKFVCLSATVPNLEEMARWIGAVRRCEVNVVREDRRPVPLEHVYYIEGSGPGSLDDLKPSARARRVPREPPRALTEAAAAASEADLLDCVVERGHLPCLYFSSSRKACEVRAFEHARRELLTDKERRQALQLFDRICGERGAPALRKLISKGVAYHHAGVLPTMKDVVERMFASGLLKLLFTTETFAVGVNMPAKAVVLDSLEKFDGREVRYLKAREFQQMAGRAGRRGKDERGFVYVRIDPEQAVPGAVHRIVTGAPERIESRFNLGYSSILSLYGRYGEGIHELLEMSFGRSQAAKRLDELQKEMREARARASGETRCAKGDPRRLMEYIRLARDVARKKWSLKRRIRRARKELKGDKRRRDRRLQEIGREARLRERQLAKTVCATCPGLEDCLRQDKEIAGARRAYANLLDEMERVESYQPAQIRKRLDLLRSLGYIQEGGLSPKGRTAAWICGYELQTTELLFAGIFDLMDEDQINALVTAIVFESRRNTWYRPAGRGQMTDVFYEAEKCMLQLLRREETFGIRGIRVKSLDASLTGAVYAWSREGCDFDALAGHTDAFDGDLVRAFRMTVDLLRQTHRAVAGHPSLRERLERSMARINRGVVDAESQLRGSMGFEDDGQEKKEKEKENKA